RVQRVLGRVWHRPCPHPHPHRAAHIRQCAHWTGPHIRNPFRDRVRGRRPPARAHLKRTRFRAGCHGYRFHLGHPHCFWILDLLSPSGPCPVVRCHRHRPHTDHATAHLPLGRLLYLCHCRTERWHTCPNGNS